MKIRIRIAIGLCLATVAASGLARASIPEARTPVGSTDWSARYNSGSDRNYSQAIAVSKDGSRVFVTGYSVGIEGTGDDYVTIAYDAVTGSQLWLARYDAGLDDDARGIALLGGAVVVTGSSQTSPEGPQSDYVTIAYDASNGNQLWLSRYHGSYLSADGASSIATDGTLVYVTGTSFDIAGYTYATVAYDATGSEVWEHQTPTHTYAPVAPGITASPSGVYVTGSAQMPVGSDYLVTKLDNSSGSEAWLRTHHGNAPSSNDSIFGARLAPNGSSLYVTGAAGSAADTIAYDTATGNELWKESLVGDTSDEGHGVTVSADGSAVYVTAERIQSATQRSYQTLAYKAADGSLAWTANHAQTPKDSARSITTNPTGSRILVSGLLNTIAYDGAGHELWATQHGSGLGSIHQVMATVVAPSGADLYVTGPEEGFGADFSYRTVAYRLTDCRSGLDEDGPVSGVVRGVEPSTGPATPYVHGISCDVLAANGL